MMGNVDSDESFYIKELVWLCAHKSHKNQRMKDE